MMRVAVRWRRFGVGLLLVALGVVAASVAALWRPKADPDQLWNQARVAFEQRRFDQTESLLRQVGRLRDPTPLDWMLRGEVALARNRPKEASADLDGVPDTHPMGPQARLQQGQIELRRGRARMAEQHYLRAVQLDPRLVQAHRELIYIYGMQLRRRELADQFRALAQRSPLSQRDVFIWCLTRGCVWDPPEVVATLERFLKADPTDRWSRLGLAANLRQMRRLEEAAVALGPLPDSDPDARALRAMLALDRNEPAAAQALLADGPTDHAELALLRGRLALSQNDPDTALRHFRLAEAADPEQRDTVFYLGLALRKVGDEAAAKPYVEKARRFDQLNALVQRASTKDGRDDPHLSLDLGAACEAVHRIPEARAWYRVAIARDPFDADAQKALYRLAQQDSEASKQKVTSQK
jgi:tetratricopeptide (TPR) repeat protein